MSSAVMMLTLAGASCRVCGCSAAPSTLTCINCSMVSVLMSFWSSGQQGDAKNNAAPSQNAERFIQALYRLDSQNCVVRKVLPAVGIILIRKQRREPRPRPITALKELTCSKRRGCGAHQQSSQEQLRAARSLP